MTIVVIGYTPLFINEFKIDFDSGIKSDLFRKWQEFDNPSPLGVLWSYNNDNILTALLIIDKAKKVFDHLTLWCENNVEEWFTYHFKKFETGYCICVHPNIKKSIDRLKENSFLKYGAIVDTSEVLMVYRPLACIGTSLKTIDSIKNFDPTKMKIGLIDILDMQSQNHENHYILEGIKYGGNDYEDYIKSLIDEYKKEN